MVEDRVQNGRRIGQLLASEIRGRADDPHASLAVVDVRDVQGSIDGTFAFAIAREDESADTANGGTDGTEDDDTVRVAEVFVHDDRARIEFRTGVEAAAEAGREAGLRVRPKAVRPPRTLVFVEDGVQVKRVLQVMSAALTDQR